jgi:hypothetical protein
MTADLRFQTIHRTVTELFAAEDDLAERLEQAEQFSSGHIETLAAIQRLRPMVEMHRDQLAAYLKDAGGDEPGRETNSPRSPSKAGTALSEVLRDLSLAFHRCAICSATLFEVALRLYEPRLREIAPKHLKTHADAALSTARLLPEVVARQLAQDGLLCACICPMCSIGACGCVAYGTQTLTTAWRDAVPAASGQPGFVLLTPKAESQLARTGVRGGEVLLAVDGQRVSDFAEVQAAVRRHTIGDEVRFLIQRGSELPRELRVRHVNDYPKT